MLSGRLNVIAHMVPTVETVADIGCDHGKMAVWLVKNERAQKAVCGDVSSRSLDKAKRLVAARGLDDRISLRHGDGFQVLHPGEAQAAVVAGMGGELIVSILEAEPEKTPGILVLSCHTSADILRKWLSGHGYRIEDEELVFENRHYYPVIKAVRGESAVLTEMELEFGPVILQKKPKMLRPFVKRRLEKSKEIRGSIQKSDSPRRVELLREIDKRISDYTEVERCL